jgi:hypothetical protein
MLEELDLTDDYRHDYYDSPIDAWITWFKEMLPGPKGFLQECIQESMYLFAASSL